VKELVKSKVMNPVFILDEVDKLSKHQYNSFISLLLFSKISQGVDPYYALMEILNPEENHNFTDHYLDIKVDFSNVIFILTANQILNMLEPLRNRLEIIEVPAYIEQEKVIYYCSPLKLILLSFLLVNNICSLLSLLNMVLTLIISSLMMKPSLELSKVTNLPFKSNPERLVLL